MVVRRHICCDLRSVCWRTIFGISLFLTLWLPDVTCDMRSEYCMPLLAMLCLDVRTVLDVEYSYCLINHASGALVACSDIALTK